MRNLLVYLLLLIFSINGFAQKPNKSAPQRKKNSVKEIRFYTENDSIPVKVLYYDKLGRMTKIISFENESYDGQWTAETCVYDTRGRLTSVKYQYCEGSKLENMKFDSCWRVTNFTYSGDTMSFEIDSTWNTPEELNVIYTTRIVRWTKHPAPFPKPVFWQDSLCKKTLYGKSYEIHYSKAGEPKIDKIDSLTFFQKTESFMQNGKLYHVTTLSSSYDKTIEYEENTEMFTLHDKFDTTIENRVTKHFPEALAANPLLLDYHMPADTGFFETIRNTKQEALWTIETRIYNGKPFVFGKKRLENVFGFPEEDNSLTQYFESWNYNSGDVEELTITYHKKYLKGHVTQKIIHW